MADRKLIPTWLKVAAVAALFIPHTVSIDRDEDAKLKKVSTRSLAAQITYTPATEDKKGDITVVFPGSAGEQAEAEGTSKTYAMDRKKIVGGAKQAYGVAADKVKKAANSALAKFNKNKAERVLEDELVAEELEDCVDEICDAIEEALNEESEVSTEE